MNPSLMRIVLAQINLKVGDIHFNAKRIQEAAIQAKNELHADMIVFPEMSLTGYPADDLWHDPHFIESCEQVTVDLVKHISDIYIVIGYPKFHHSELMNRCGIFYNGNCLGEYDKHCLPNQGVFDDKRYFKPGKQHCVIRIRDLTLGLLICEDLWHDEPIRTAAHHGADLIISLNASPYEKNKFEKRQKLIEGHAKKYQLPIIYVNQVGGQDDLVFDGQSFVVNQTGEIVAKAMPAQEELLPVDLKIYSTQCEILKSKCAPLISETQALYDLLVLSVRDYIHKNQFKRVVLGLSGGMDSALVLSIAVDAIGADHVHTIFLPGPFNSEMSLIDAKTLADNLNVSFQNISIHDLFEQYKQLFSEQFQTPERHLVNENIQARIRGNILMAYSNQHQALLLSTGNRSELAVGYCTLYGDMAGGFAPIKDILKTEVYELAHYRNQIHPHIPDNIISREPSAELAPDQKDTDSLPPYPILDAILVHHLDHLLCEREIVELGFEKKTVQHILNLIKKNEYKRKQAPLGPHFHIHSFTRARRFPICNGFMSAQEKTLPDSEKKIIQKSTSS